LQAVLAYLYFGNYPRYPPMTDSSETFYYHVIVHALAEKWAIEPLKKIALARFTDTVAAAHNETGFLDVVEQVYVSTPEKSKIRLVAASVVKRYSAVVCANDQSRSRFLEIEGLAADLASLCMGWTEDPIKHWRFGE